MSLLYQLTPHIATQPYPLPEDTSYGYYVSKPACIAFIAFFGTSTREFLQFPFTPLEI